MDALLQALKLGDPIEVDTQAKLLFTCPGGKLNKAQVNEFERYAPCHILPISGDSVFLAIAYGNTTFMVG